MDYEGYRQYTTYDEVCGAFGRKALDRIHFEVTGTASFVRA